MKDQSKKLQNLKEDSNAVFEDLFGGVEKTPLPDTSGEVEKVGEGKYRMGNSVITKLRGVSEHEFLAFNFGESALSWLLNAKFEGDLDLKLTGGQPQLTTFQGKWYDGIFKGKFFGIASEFYGGQFGDSDANPAFLPEYTGWKTSPHYFYGGVIKRHQNGILGYKNLEIGAIGTSFNIIAIQPGNTVTIELKSGIKHTITCNKRLGGNNRTFHFAVTNGKTNKTYSITHDWSELKGGDKTEFLAKTNINLQTATKTIGMFGLDISEGIASATVSVAGTSGVVQQSVSDQDFLTTQQTYNLSKIPLLNITKAQKGWMTKKGEQPDSVYFYIPDNQYFTQFNNSVSNIESGQLQRDMSMIRSGLRNNIIKGYDASTPFLAKLFNNVSGDNEGIDKKTQEALVRMNEFMQYFVDRMFISGDNNKEDEANQALVTNNMKKSIGVDEFLQQAQETPEQGETQAPTKVRPPKLQENKDIIEAVRSIIFK